MRRHLTFANVCSFLALTVALGTGGAYAAGHVFSADIVDGEVRTPDVAMSAITATKIAPESLSSGRVFGLDGTDVDANGLKGEDILESSLGRVPDAAKLGGVPAQPAAQVVKPADELANACASPSGTGTFCSVGFPPADYDPAWRHFGGGHQPVRFYKDALGVVHLEGLVTQGTVDPAVEEVVFVLPTGHRPAARRVFATIGLEWNGPRPSLGRVDVYPDGRVVLEHRPDTDPASSEPTAWFSFDGMSFRTG